MTQTGVKTKRLSSSRLYTRARAILISLAALYALAVICVMTPLIQTQFALFPFASLSLLPDVDDALYMLLSCFDSMVLVSCMRTMSISGVITNSTIQRITA